MEIQQACQNIPFNIKDDPPTSMTYKRLDYQHQRFMKNIDAAAPDFDKSLYLEIMEPLMSDLEAQFGSAGGSCAAPARQAPRPAAPRSSAPAARAAAPTRDAKPEEEPEEEDGIKEIVARMKDLQAYFRRYSKPGSNKPSGAAMNLARDLNMDTQDANRCKRIIQQNEILLETVAEFNSEFDIPSYRAVVDPYITELAEAVGIPFTPYAEEVIPDLSSLSGEEYFDTLHNQTAPLFAKLPTRFVSRDQIHEITQLIQMVAVELKETDSQEAFSAKYQCLEGTRTSSAALGSHLDGFDGHKGFDLAQFKKEVYLAFETHAEARGFALIDWKQQEALDKQAAADAQQAERDRQAADEHRHDQLQTLGHLPEPRENLFEYYPIESFRNTLVELQQLEFDFADVPVPYGDCFVSEFKRMDALFAGLVSNKRYADARAMVEKMSGLLEIGAVLEPENAELAELNVIDERVEQMVHASLADLTGDFHRENQRKVVASKQPVPLDCDAGESAFSEVFVPGDEIYVNVYLSERLHDALWSAPRVKLDGTEFPLKIESELSATPNALQVCLMPKPDIAYPKRSYYEAPLCMARKFKELADGEHVLELSFGAHASGELTFAIDSSSRAAAEQYFEELKHSLLQNSFMPQAELEDEELKADFVAAYKRDWEPEYEILDIRIVSNRWHYHKNALGIMEYRSMSSAVAMKNEERGCVCFDLGVRQDFTGMDSWTPTYFCGVGDSYELAEENVFA